MSPDEASKNLRDQASIYSSIIESLQQVSPEGFNPKGLVDLAITLAEHCRKNRLKTAKIIDLVSNIKNFDINQSDIEEVACSENLENPPFDMDFFLNHPFNNDK